MLLAFETSCDETAVAVLDYKAFLRGVSVPEKALLADLISSQTKLHEAYGGVVPELAAREHLINLPALLEEALRVANIHLRDVTTIAVTRGPGLKGCLLVGLCFAKALAYSLRVPLIPVNHIEGHIFAGELVPETERPLYPLLALIVSGGHTQLVLAEEPRNYKLIATTRDDAAGEAFDKTATLLGLPYPGGPALSKAALDGDSSAFSFPIAVPKDLTSFSFSGLKTAVSRTVSNLQAKTSEAELPVGDLAASVESAIVSALTQKTREACRSYKPKSLVLTGGVAANRVLREELAQVTERLGVSFTVPKPKWCTDNAAMIAVAGARMFEQNQAQYEAWDSCNRSEQDFLAPGVPSDIDALPRWPVWEG